MLEHFGPATAASLDDVSRLALLSCAERWCTLVERFEEALHSAHLGEGLGSFARYLARYCAADSYLRLKDDIAHTKKLLGYVQCSLLVDDMGMRVRKYQGEPALSRGLEDLIRPFEPYETKPEPEWPAPAAADPAMDAAVLEAASRDFGDQFRALQTFCERHTAFADEKIARFAWDVRFYLAWLTLTDKVQEKGSPVSLPTFAGADDIVELKDVCDGALALGDGCVPYDGDACARRAPCRHLGQAALRQDHGRPRHHPGCLVCLDGASRAGTQGASAVSRDTLDVDAGHSRCKARDGRNPWRACRRRRRCPPGP
ncbi:MAG: hypothetical protein LKE92_04640 [Atopobiaceae bacterium]|nr:hypothetical protein [Atopobiaceae bacterium]